LQAKTRHVLFASAENGYGYVDFDGGDPDTIKIAVIMDARDKPLIYMEWQEFERAYLKLKRVREEISK
jgi:hypothetical protein